MMEVPAMKQQNFSITKMNDCKARLRVKRRGKKKCGNPLCLMGVDAPKAQIAYYKKSIF
jgi:hypothetical protein